LSLKTEDRGEPQITLVPQMIAASKLHRVSREKILLAELAEAQHWLKTTLELELQHTCSAVVADVFKWRKRIKRGF
jgi:hypothetical protein